MTTAVHTLVWIVSALLIGTTLLSLVRSAKWWVRVWDYPRLQLAAAIAIALVAQLVLLPTGPASIGLLAATGGCMAWQLFRVYPYTPMSRVQVTRAEAVAGDAAVGIVVANVLQQNRDAAGFLRRIHDADPDIVLAVETDRWWDAQIACLQQDYPYAVRHPLENTYGICLFSRLVLEDVRVQDRVSSQIPSISAGVRLRSGTLIRLHCVHPEPPQPGNDVEERDAELLLVAREVAADRGPTIVCGDLNDVAWSRTTRLFQRISGLLDPRVGRGIYPTFHAQHWLARWPLDHIFIDASFRLERIEVLGPFGSDHFPVHARLVHDPSAVHDHVIERADRDDQQEAEETIAEGRRAG